MDFGVFALSVAYLVPWIFAVARQHERQISILAGNLIFGWTGIGWLGVFAWAIASDAHPSRHRVRPALRVVKGRG